MHTLAWFALCILPWHAVTFHILTSSQPLFLLGCSISLVPSASTVIQCLTQSTSSLCSICEDCLTLPFVVIKLTASNRNISQSSALFFSYTTISIWSYSALSKADISEYIGEFYCTIFVGRQYHLNFVARKPPKMPEGANEEATSLPIHFF